MFTISELYQYPLKSAGGNAVATLRLDAHGPTYDRHWMVVGENGKFLTQRQHPKMCLIGTQLRGDRLSLVAPEMPPLEVGSSAEQLECLVWKDSVVAHDCGDQSALWLSRYLGKSCRLAQMPVRSPRLVDSNYADQGETVSFADGFPLLVVSQASLDEFNTKLESSIGMERFRPNIVVAGCPPFAEDSWREITVGDIKLSLVKPCSRCIIPSINPSNGSKEMAVNQALLKYRRRDGKTFFGQNALHRSLGNIRVGDTVKVLA